MIYTKYIRDLGEKTKIPLRTVEAEWKIAQKQLDFDTMMEPNKYTHLRKLDGTFAEEVARRVEKSIMQPENASEEEQQVVPGEEPIEGQPPQEALNSDLNKVAPETSKEEPPVEQIENSNPQDLPSDNIPEEASDFAMTPDSEEGAPSTPAPEAAVPEMDTEKKEEPLKEETKEVK
jgi:hypothetical protein